MSYTLSNGVTGLNIVSHDLLHFVDPRSASMKAAYDGELVGLLQETDVARSKMEAWYALRLEDEQVVGDQLNMYDTLVAQFDSMMTKINGSTKLVKNAIVPSLQQRLYCFLK